jgi:hypothetical protein
MPDSLGKLDLLLLTVARARKVHADRFPAILFPDRFVHEFRPLSAVEIRGLLAWSLRAIELPSMASVDQETIATIIRITGGNFRLLARLLMQIERILKLNRDKEGQ